jgi:hypothetical protein
VSRLRAIIVLWGGISLAFKSYVGFLEFLILYFDFPKDIYLFFNYIGLVNSEAILSSLVDFWEFPSKEEE